MPEERLVWQGSSSQWTNLGAYLMCALVFALFVTLTLYFRQSIGEGGGVVMGLVTVLLLLPPGYALLRWFLLRAKRYEVTSERIKVTTGILTRQTVSLELYRVKDYTLVEPFLMRLLKLGHVVLVTSDPTTPRLELTAIPGAKALFNDIRTCVEQRRDVKRVRALDIDETAGVAEGEVT